MKAVTSKGCTLLIIPTDNIYKPFSEKHALRERLIKNVIKTLCDKSIFLTEKLTHISQRKLRDKIIAYLSYESIRNNSSSFYIPYSRQQLAEYLCVDRSALSNNGAPLSGTLTLKSPKTGDTVTIPLYLVMMIFMAALACLCIILTIRAHKKKQQ